MHSQESEQVPSFVRIATFENGDVKLHEDTLKLIDPERSHYPVAVVSVIGRTKEPREAAIKALVGSLYKETTDGSCALIANESESNEADGIFAIFPPGSMTNEFGEISVLILDISCPNHTSASYSNLANACSLVSSVLVYTASSNDDKMTNINIEMSELKSLGPSFLSVAQLWAIIQDCDSSVCTKPGAARLLTAEYERLGLSESTKEEILTLASYSGSATRILLAKETNDAEECPLQRDSAEYSSATLKATCQHILKKAIGIQGVKLGFLVPYFRLRWRQLEAGEATYSSRESERETRQFQKEECQTVSKPSDLSTPLKLDENAMKSMDVEPIQIDSTTDMSGLDASTVPEDTSTRDLEEQKDTIPADGYVAESTRINTDTLVGTQTKHAALTFSKESESNLMDSGLGAQGFTEQEPELMEVNTSDGIVSHDRLLTEDINHERVLLENAVKHSLERYAEIMKEFVPPPNIFGVKFIQEVHEFACPLVLEAAAFQDLTMMEKLQGTLATFVQERLEENFTVMRKLDKKEEKLRRMCGMHYMDRMSTKVSEKAVSLEMAQQIHEESVRDIKQWFRKQCGDVLEPIKGYWERVLDVKFEFWKTCYMNEFEVKQDLPPATGFSLSAQNEQPIESTSVGVYFGLDVVQFGLYSSDLETFSKSCVEIPPFICFKDKKILIGEVAKKCNTCSYNVYQVISRPTDKTQGRSVKLYSKVFVLTSNEIAVLFFHEAKKQFESSVKTRVTTCAVAASGLLPSASKQGLVSALRMSGFNLVKFIPTTTAILVWYLKSRAVEPHRSTQKPPRVLAIHHTGPMVEVVKGEILDGQRLNMRSIGGFLNYKDFTGPERGRVVGAIRDVMSDVVGSSKDFEQTIMIHGSQNDSVIMETIQKYIGHTLKTAHCEEQSHSNILHSAAAYDAHTNGEEMVTTHYLSGFPTFNHLIPHKLSIQISRKTTLEFPISGSWSSTLTLPKTGSSFTICESTKRPKTLFDYPYSYVKGTSSPPQVAFKLTLWDDGRFSISGASLTCHNYQFISEFGKEHMEEKIAKVLHEKERYNTEESKGSCHTEMPTEKVAEDAVALKATLLRSQLEDVKQRLEVSGNSIKPMILEGIKDRIKACEKLLGQQDVKEKQLIVAIGQLQVAAKRITPCNN